MVHAVCVRIVVVCSVAISDIHEVSWMRRHNSVGNLSKLDGANTVDGTKRRPEIAVSIAST